MAQRYEIRSIGKDRVYTIRMAARTIGATEATFRNWVRDGLTIISDKRPFLVRGADLIHFLNNRRAANKSPMTTGQFFCMRCKAPRDPLERKVEYAAINALTGRLSGVCATCGCKVGRFCNVSDLEGLGDDLVIARKASTAD